MYSSREVKSRSAKAKRQRTRKSGVLLMSAHCRWQQFKSAGGWTHSELALHLMDIHEKFCGTGCSAKHSTSKIKSIVDTESTVVASYKPVGNQQQAVSKEQEPVPPMKLRIPRTIASVPATLPDVSTSSQDLSNGNDHKANTALSLVVIPARMNIPTEESFNSGKIKENVVILPGDVESVSNRLEDSEKPEITAAEDNPLNAKYVRDAIGEESDGEEAAVIIVGTPGDGEDEGFDAPMQPT